MLASGATAFGSADVPPPEPHAARLSRTAARSRMRTTCNERGRLRCGMVPPYLACPNDTTIHILAARRSCAMGLSAQTKPAAHRTSARARREPQSCPPGPSGGDSYKYEALAGPAALDWGTTYTPVPPLFLLPT